MDNTNTKLFMRAPDAETAESVAKFFGEKRTFSPVLSTNSGGMTIKENVDKGFYNRPVKQDKGASSLDGKFVGENPTPLIAALYFGYNDIAKALINIGADINKPNDYPFYSPLMVAAESGNKEMVNLLLEKVQMLTISLKWMVLQH